MSEAAAEREQVVVNGDQRQPGPRLLHLGHENPLLRVGVKALDTGPIHVQDLVVTSWNKTANLALKHQFIYYRNFIRILS